MFYLILAIISSTFISILMRASEKHIANQMGMFAANYAACCALSVFYSEWETLGGAEISLAPILLCGVISGMLYLGNFIFLKYNMQKNGIVLSSTFMKLGVLIPTLMAVFVFREMPRTSQVIGIAIAVVAIVIFNFEKEAMKDGSHKYLLLVLLLLSGITDSMAKVYEQMGEEAGSDYYLLVTFLVAFALAVILAFRNQSGIHVADLGYGLLIGIPNYYSARFLLKALGSVEAVLVYPLYSVATIILITIAGVFIFKEKLSKQKIVALMLVLLAICLLNL